MRTFPKGLAAAALSLALVAAACGDDNDATPAAGPTTTMATGGANSGMGGAANGAATEADADIVETAVAAGDFTTLAAALEAAGLVETLRGDGPFTVFAPTDEAFAALPAGTLDDLLRPENRDQLREILTYHVVAGEVTAAEVTELDEAETVAGQPVRIGVQGNDVLLNGDVRVVQTDIMTANGVIHVIDGVLLPPAAS